MFGKKRNAFGIFTGVSIAALGAAAPAMAQEARTGDEIIVTAQKREQNIQDVPIAVTALSGDELERAGIQDIRALQNLSASFNLNSTQTDSGGTTIRIRGVGTTGNNAGLESSVGVFLDGVYLTRPSVALGELLEVQQIEILRGPQGTLFGRNTSAGALTITTKAPSLSEFHAFGNMTAGTVDGRDFPSLASAQIGVSGPVIEDKLAFSIAAGGRTRNNLLTSTFENIEQNTRDRFLVRGQALFAPTDDIAIRVILDHQKSRDNCCDAVVLKTADIAPFFTASGLPANGGVVESGFGAVGARRSNSNQQFQDPTEQTGLSAQVDWDLGWAAATYIGATRNTEASPNVQDDFTGISTYAVGGIAEQFNPAAGENYGKGENMSHEFRLSGETGRLQWNVGAYYGQEDIETGAGLTLGPDFQAVVNANLLGGLFAALGPGGLTAVNANPALTARTLAAGASASGAYANNLFTQSAETTSIFTHNTLSVTDKLDFTIGLRFVEESKDGAFRQLSAFNPACLGAIAVNAGTPSASPLKSLTVANRGAQCFPFSAPANLPNAGTGNALDPLTPATFSKTFEDEELVYTGNVTYAFTDDVKGYASLTHGFKSGGFNLDPTAAAGGADPRFKSEKTDSYELGLKADFFDGRLRANAAVFHSDIEDFQVLEFTGIQFQTFNVAKVKSTGAELELAAQLSDTIGATAALTYTDARYPSDCVPTTASLTVRSLCGSQLTNAPDFVGIFGVNFDRPIAAAFRLYGDASIRYESERRTSTQSHLIATSAAGLRATLLPLDIQEANSKTNMRIGMGSQDERWGVELWGTNVFNEQTRNVTFNLPLQTGGRAAFLEDPAMYGVTLRVNY